MGTQIKSLLKIENIQIDFLSGKKIAVDSLNWLYQFLSSIRQYDGALLMNSKGEITSHLAGLFSRCIFLLENNIRPIFVFDGTPPSLKQKEQEIRKERKIKAELKLKEAIDKQDIESMKKYSKMTSKLSPKMILDSKRLLDALGIPYIQAPSEGEAQAAYLVRNNDAFCCASQDFDSLVFGACKVVRNLNKGAKKKKANSLLYNDVEIELISLEDNLKNLGISNDELIVLSMLVGNDFTQSGINGIGPKKGLALVKKHNQNFDMLFKEVLWDEESNGSWKEIFDLIKNMPINTNYSVEFKAPDINKVKEILVLENEFSNDRIESSLLKIAKKTKEKSQSSLGNWL
ncbi:MAG TPA: flap endonuclease-1 [Candidatus Woesearchaeota archaeon]|nr:flap endonuclease-1 [Candidatus Woesearchaeota archaeon]